MAASMTRQLLDKGHELREEYSNLLEKRSANRRSLRDLDAQDFLSAEEQAELDELYPPRNRNVEEPGEDAAGE